VKPKISTPTLTLFFICFLDLLSTLYLVLNNHAVEGNPLMAHYLAMGIGPFILAKLFLTLPALFLAEWHRRKRKEFVERLLWTTVFLYVVLYTLMVSKHQ
jgi:hypothetical protein